MSLELTLKPLAALIRVSQSSGERKYVPLLYLILYLGSITKMMLECRAYGARSVQHGVLHQHGMGNKPWLWVHWIAYTLALQLS